MKKAVLLLPVLVLALTSTAFAQVAPTTDKDKSDAVKVTVNGFSDLNWVYRDTWINAVRNGGSLAGDGFVGNPTTHISNYTVIGLKVDLSTKVSAVMELGTDPIDDFVTEFQVIDTGPLTFLNAGSGTLLGNTFQTIRFWNLYVEATELGVDGLGIRAGQVHTTFKIREEGGSLVFDSFWAENPQNNVNVILDSTIEDVASAGVVANYVKGVWAFEFGLLPVVQEFIPSRPKDDGAVYYASLNVSNKENMIGGLSPKSKAGFIALLMHLPNDPGTPGVDENASLMTFGGGVDLFFLENDALEVYGEFYLNSGRAQDVPKVKASGQAFQLGLKYVINVPETKPWLEFKYTYLSGDDDPTDNKAKNYLSMEDQRDLMIIEDPVFGLDIDSNLKAIKLGGGLSFAVAGAPLTLSGMLGIATTAKKVPVGAPLSNESGLGNEFDVRASYAYSKALGLNANLAYLMGSDIISGLTTVGTTDGEDTTWMFTLGGKVSW